ncbi:GNAT family N-acetyltransferase [Acinetobacter haemolyticus]|uniref:GNAT family N-acetyltransferase n=1 Tax=Acinetobacter haemolyticus TaxID=29430 RepID=UPI000D69B970|nr:GNAT family N-acetyltransferase [Acinetobacter haemolyticus]
MLSSAFLLNRYKQEMMKLKTRKAIKEDVGQIVELLNSAYRTQSGRSWTTEKIWVEGNRITVKQLNEELEKEQFELFVGENEQKQIIACIGLTFEDISVEIGTFAIKPMIQNVGYGREMLGFVEHYITVDHPQISNLFMYVLDVRHELVTYYQRRGYQQTGNILPYPLDADVGLPLASIQLIEMKKYLKPAM